MLLQPGQIFASRYRVQRCIAEGGMGAIFEAEHTATERRVALKLLFPHVIGVGSARKKFELEAKISARVNNPHIVEVLDAGFDEASQSPFLVMELLDGQTLAERVDAQGPLAPREALRLLQQVAIGLDAAHGYRDPDGTPKPIVHRDLKPENLFLARTHEGGVSAKILDYGIAKMLGETVNLSQEVRGTPLFMAFEQITAGPLSAQTDIWALGLIAFYMLTGLAYWRSAEREQLSVQSLFAEILMLPLEPPSVRLQEKGCGVALPPAFDAWLLCCIDREPAQRFPTATAAIDALARVFDVALEARATSPVRLLTSAEKSQTLSGAAVARAPSAGAASAPARPRPAPPRRVPPGLSWRWVAAGALGGMLLLGSIAWLAAREGGPSAGPVPAHERSAFAPAGPARTRSVSPRGSEATASGRPGGAGQTSRVGLLEGESFFDERNSAAGARAAERSDERAVEARDRSAPAPGAGASGSGAGASGSGADADDAAPEAAAAVMSSGGASGALGPSRAVKPAKPKRRARPSSEARESSIDARKGSSEARKGSSEAYQVR